MFAIQWLRHRWHPARIPDMSASPLGSCLATMWPRRMMSEQLCIRDRLRLMGANSESRHSQNTFRMTIETTSIVNIRHDRRQDISSMCKCECRQSKEYISMGQDNTRAGPLVPDRWSQPPRHRNIDACKAFDPKGLACRTVRSQQPHRATSLMAAGQARRRRQKARAAWLGSVSATNTSPVREAFLGEIHCICTIHGGACTDNGN